MREPRSDIMGLPKIYSRLDGADPSCLAAVCDCPNEECIVSRMDDGKEISKQAISACMDAHIACWRHMPPMAMTPITMHEESVTTRAQAYLGEAK